MYGPASALGTEAYVDWLYPPVPGRPAPLWLMLENDTVEATQGAIRVDLKIGDAHRPALWLMDLMVNPTSQKRGQGTAVSEAAFAETRVAMGFEVSDIALVASKKLGWLDHGTVPLHFLPVDLEALGQARWRLPWPKLMTAPWRAWLDFLHRRARARLEVQRLVVEPWTAFDARVDDLWAKASPHYPVVGRRDHASLSWRFDATSVPTRYERYGVLHEGKVVGYFVTRMGERHGLSAGYIVDFFCEPHLREAVVTLAVDRLSGAGVRAIYCLHQSPDSLKVFARLGFSRRDSRWPVIVRSEGLPEGEARLFNERDNWFLTSADSDVDRPREGTVYAQ